MDNFTHSGPSGWECVPGRGSRGVGTAKQSPALEPVPGLATAGGKVWLGGALWWSPRSLPPISTVQGIGSQFLSSARRSLSLGRGAGRGVGRSAPGLLAGEVRAAEPGVSLQTLPSLSSRSHAPPLQVPGDPAFSGTREGKGPGQRDRSGPVPLHCSAGTLNDSLCPPGEKSRWVLCCQTASPCPVRSGPGAPPPAS